MGLQRVGHDWATSLSFPLWIQKSRELAVLETELVTYSCCLNSDHHRYVDYWNRPPSTSWLLNVDRVIPLRTFLNTAKLNSAHILPMLCLVAQLCPTLCGSMDCKPTRLLCSWGFLKQNKHHFPISYKIEVWTTWSMSRLLSFHHVLISILPFSNTCLALRTLKMFFLPSKISSSFIFLGELNVFQNLGRIRWHSIKPSWNSSLCTAITHLTLYSCYPFFNACMPSGQGHFLIHSVFLLLSLVPDSFSSVSIIPVDFL